MAARTSQRIPRNSPSIMRQETNLCSPLPRSRDPNNGGVRDCEPSAARNRRVAILGLALVAAACGPALVVALNESGSEQHLPVFLARIPESDATGRFGTAVALDGDTMVVGLPGTGSDGAHGRVEIYVAADQEKRDWRLHQILLAPAHNGLPSATVNDLFGSAVDIEDNTLVVGAPAHSAGGFGDPTAACLNSQWQPRAGTGAAYVFERHGSIWQFAKYLKEDAERSDFSPPHENGDAFGSSVAIADSGMFIAVGSPTDDRSIRIPPGDAFTSP